MGNAAKAQHVKDVGKLLHEAQRPPGLVSTNVPVTVTKLDFVGLL